MPCILKNPWCFACDRAVGYLPDEMLLSALEPIDDGTWLALTNDGHYRQCKNHSEYDVCNWMVPIEDTLDLCVSCRLNHIIPNLNVAENFILWYRIPCVRSRVV
jgi:hypothetical protein